MARDLSFLRPRFLPDRDALREWGDKGAWIVRLIRKAFAVPPSAAMGATQIQKWLETLPEHARAMEAWRSRDPQAQARLEELALAVRGELMPEHWTLSAGTLRSFLCGDPAEFKDSKELDDTWPMLLRLSPSAAVRPGDLAARIVERTSAERLWQALTELLATVFTGESFERIERAGTDPTALRWSILFQPRLVAELTGTCRGTQAESSPELAPFLPMLMKRARKAERIAGGPVELDWLWDGAQLWFLAARTLDGTAPPSSGRLARWIGRWMRRDSENHHAARG